MPKTSAIIFAVACAGGFALTARAADAGKPPAARITVAPPAANSGRSDTLTSPHANQSMTVDALLGYVNDQPIFASDIFRDPQLNDSLTQLGKNARSLSDFENNARTLITARVNHVISEQLLYSAAQSALTDAERARVDTEIDFERRKLIADYGDSQAAADQALAVNHSSVKLEMDAKKKRFIDEIYLERHIYRNIEITQQMARDEYARDPKRWHQSEQLELDTLTLPVSRWLREPSTNGEAGSIMAHPTSDQIKAAEAKAMAAGKEIVGKLKAGTDFSRLVQDYNSVDDNFLRGGKSRPLEPGTLNDTTYEKRIFALPANAIDEPYLYHDDKDFRQSKVVVTKVLTKRPEKVVAFVEAQDEIMSDLQARQLLELQEKAMAKLSAGAPVEAVLRMMDVALNAAVTRYATAK